MSEFENLEHPEFLGKFKIKMDETVILPKQENTVDFNVDVVPANMSTDDYMKAKYSKEEYEKWRYETSCDRSSETDRADKYRTSHRKNYEEKGGSFGYTVIEVLEFLKGQPWNNLALNYAHALRPSCIRVSGGEITTDAVKWRVTVYLEDDNRTIRLIEQEVEVGLYGAEDGYDLRNQMSHQIKHGRLEGYPQKDINSATVFYNEAALDKINLGEQKLPEDKWYPTVEDER